MKKSFQGENEERYNLLGNTSLLSFRDGSMVSQGTLSKITIKIDLLYCKGCGICAEECPTDSLTMELERGKLRESIQASYPDASGDARTFNPKQLLAWQDLPHYGGLVVADGIASYNRTGAWRVGEVVVGNADLCVLCGLCYQHCPEDIISIENDDGGFRLGEFPDNGA